MRSFDTAIGLEVHVELRTDSKIFCRCPNRGEKESPNKEEESLSDDKAPPNKRSCPICQGQPGVLPALNPDVVQLAIRCALALNCTVSRRSTFERKHYVYPDIPKNYQITQNENPIGQEGWILLRRASGELRVPIKRVHMEEDAAKLEHRFIDGRRASLVDFNRCGVPLLEIVSEPEMSDPADAVIYLRTLRQIIRWHGISDAEMSQGRMRCDANLSVRPVDTPLEEAVKWEVKNLNSIDAVEAALRRARERQRHDLRGGDSPRKALKQTTFHWDEQRRDIQPRRKKETADDYFYFAEPDLLEVRITPAQEDAIRESIKTGPREARQEAEALSLSHDCVQALTGDRIVYDYWREACREYPASAKTLANLIVNNLRACANERRMPFEDYIAMLPSHRLGEIARRIDSGELIRDARLNELIDVVRDKSDVIVIDAAKKMGLASVRIGNEEEERQLRALLDESPKEVTDYRSGKEAVVGFLVGKARYRLPGAKPADLQRTLVRLLSEERQDSG